MNHIKIEDIRNLAINFVADYPETYGERPIWRAPLVVSAVADERFDILPQIAAPDHLLPKDLLPSAKTVVVFFIPFEKTLAVENHKGEYPTRSWGLAYEATNLLIHRLSEALKSHFEESGFCVALTPATHNFDTVRLMARWSHKHLGYVAGLGRFGVNAQFITPSGCAGRMGSLVTDAELGNHPLVSQDELCLHKTGQKCLKCVDRCPAGAVFVSGIDRKRCWDRLNYNKDHLEALAGLEASTQVCGKCQVLLPCSLKSPVPFDDYS
jgi:epoxyqueuosine reductase QueG